MSVFGAVEGHPGLNSNQVTRGEDQNHHTNIDQKEQSNRRIGPDRRGTRWQNSRQLGHSFVAATRVRCRYITTKIRSLDPQELSVGGISSRQRGKSAKSRPWNRAFCTCSGNSSAAQRGPDPQPGKPRLPVSPFLIGDLAEEVLRNLPILVCRRVFFGRQASLEPFAGIDVRPALWVNRREWRGGRGAGVQDDSVDRLDIL